ncbi:monovalent cation:proton antiporter-2 (CPA2) family protein [Xanthomarina sp. F1114]|uniref:monovalent cation:proton antiporter family protein n=1 Tax=Xanthomarina sp. F1114 TaxID=2996019 RepID=UPI00225DEEBB|nr:monovalent cation:proton antiporter family protein [Xanthomarina sp. F1114]MCX7548297.1 monovalent cation:proton antiporter-2 (CPA2) family protein [Xanthomarina sp. F1114]
MHIPLLQDILILLGFSVIIVFLLQRAKIPSILGFLITGVIIGPYGLSLVKAVEQVEVISEIGVILLLFVIGMELSLKKLAAIKKTVFIGGSIQVGLTVLIAAGCYYLMGNSWNESIFIGFLFSLSSTAIVLKVFQDRNEMNTLHGKNALGILIFQDIIVVPMMLFTPIMAGESTNVTASILTLLIKSAVVIIITIISARYVVPKLMYAIAKTNNKELFLLTTITICFAVAFLTSQAGLSLALGAFMAGLIISESEYSHQATSIILPFRELFISFFFISVGMLLDLSFFFNHVGVIMLLVLAVLVVKSSVTALAIAVLKYPSKTVLITGLSLFQIGEFAFILSKVGIEYNLLSAETNQYFLAVSIVSMLLTPFVIIFSENFAEKFLNTRIVKAMSSTPKDPFSALNDDFESELSNHLIIIGYGINGTNLAKASMHSNIPFVVIELNAKTVKREKENGIPILFGDASEPHILDTVNLSKARSVVIAISDAEATRNIIRSVREISQSVYLVVRTRYVKEIPELIALGADDVIPEEFETSIEIFSRVLHDFLIPENDISEYIDLIRADNYEIFNSKKKLPKTFKSTKIPNVNITCLRVNVDSGKIIGRTLKEMNIRKNYGINILAIERKDDVIDHIQPNEKLYQNDKLYVSGRQEAIEEFHRALN